LNQLKYRIHKTKTLLTINLEFSIVNPKKSSALLLDNIPEIGLPRKFTSSNQIERTLTNEVIQNLIMEVKTKIIHNTESGSAWHFYRFDYFQLNAAEMTTVELGNIYGGKPKSNQPTIHAFFKPLASDVNQTIRQDQQQSSDNQQQQSDANDAVTQNNYSSK